MNQPTTVPDRGKPENDDHRGTGRPRRRQSRRQGQSTLEWVIGAAIILGTLATAILVWNQGLAHKINDLVQQVTR